MAGEWDIVSTTPAQQSSSGEGWEVVSTTPAPSAAREPTAPAPSQEPAPAPAPASNMSPRARRAVEDSRGFVETISNLYDRWKLSTEGAEDAAAQRPIQGGVMGFFAPETARIMGAGMRAIPYAPVRAAGELLYKAAPAIPRASSTALGVAAGTTGTLAEREARERGLSPEAASAIGTGTELITGIGVPALASRIPRMTTATTRAEEAAKKAVTEAEARGGALERQVSGRLSETIEQSNARAAAAETRLGQIDQALQQIAERDAVAAARAENRALDPAAVAEIRRRVTRRLQDDVANATKEAREAGKSAEAARAEALERVVAAQTEKEQLRTAANKYADELLSRPQIDAAELGAQVRQIAREAEASFEASREAKAGFGEAVTSAGRFLRVDTRDIIKSIDDVLRDVRDPSVRNPLLEIKRNLVTPSRDDRMIPALNIAAADSLRKRLNSILNSRRITYENNQEGSAAAAIYHLRNVRDALMETAGKAHPAYKNAVETWRRISQAPEFKEMQRGGALKRTLTVDPLTQNELINNAEVVGQLLRTSRGGGSTVVEDLIARSPDLVNSARFYFNRELFGAGRVPSVDQLGAFLRTNERPLRAFGLYDEFATIRGARNAGQRAVENAERAVREAQASARQIEAAETRAAPARRLISTAKARQAEAVSGIETAEDIARISAERARGAERRLGAERSTAQTQVEQSRKLAHDLRTAQINIERAAPGESVAAIRPAVSRLRRDGLLSEGDYGRWITEMQAVDDAFAASARARKDADDARKAAEGVMKRWRDRLVGAASAGAGLATAGLFSLGPARYRRMFKE